MDIKRLCVKKESSYKLREMYDMESRVNDSHDVLISIKKGLKEVNEYKGGKRQLKSLNESKKLWQEWIDEDE